VNAFLYDLAQVDPEGFQALIRAEEAVGRGLPLVRAKPGPRRRAARAPLGL